MPRNDGSTFRPRRKKHLGHRMHRKTRIQRLNAPRTRGFKPAAWGRAAV